MKKRVVAATCSLLLSGAASADLYGNASYGFTESEFANRDFDTPTLNLAIGNTFTPYIAAEARLGLGLGDDSDNGLRAEIEEYFAVYAKPTLPLNEVLTIYGLLGIAETSVDTNFGDEDDDDISYGIGLSAKTRHGVDLFGEYVSLYDDDSVEIKGFNLGASMRF